MSRFILYGVPLGFSCSDCPKEDYKYLELNYVDNRKENQIHIQRLPSGNTYYSYLMYPSEGRLFSDAAGRSGAFFGMSIVLQDQVITDINKLTKLFQKTYQYYVKDKIIKELPNGNKKFLVCSLRSKDDTLAVQVGKGLMEIMKNNPELNIFNNIKKYDPAQVQQYVLNKKFLVR